LQNWVALTGVAVKVVVGVKVKVGVDEKVEVAVGVGVRRMTVTLFPLAGTEETPPKKVTEAVFERMAPSGAVFETPTLNVKV